MECTNHHGMPMQMDQWMSWHMPDMCYIMAVVEHVQPCMSNRTDGVRHMLHWAAHAKVRTSTQWIEKLIVKDVLNIPDSRDGA